jgi:hypothetical protein
MSKRTGLRSGVYLRRAILYSDVSDSAFALVQDDRVGAVFSSSEIASWKIIHSAILYKRFDLEEISVRLC